MTPEIYVSQTLISAMPKIELLDLVSMFRWWKASPSREYESPLFGKDSRLVEPKISGISYVMSHCHLIPKNNSEARVKWARDFKRRTRKTSDRVLFYVQNGQCFYLIDIADDPGAHGLMRMLDKQGQLFMRKCALEATSFLDGRLTLQPA